MKRKEIKELITKDVADLRAQLKTLTKELFTAKLDNKQRKLKNTRSLFHMKKDVARIMTILKKKELAK